MHRARCPHRRFTTDNGEKRKEKKEKKGRKKRRRQHSVNLDLPSTKSFNLRLPTIDDDPGSRVYWTERTMWRACCCPRASVKDSRRMHVFIYKYENKMIKHPSSERRPRPRCEALWSIIKQKGKKKQESFMIYPQSNLIARATLPSECRRERWIGQFSRVNPARRVIM